MRKRLTLTFLLLSLLTATSIWAANTKTTVAQVSGTVTLTDDVDYIVNGEEPFADDALVNITNKEHAVLIVERLKPSKLMAELLGKHVRIDGAVARDNVNCQVRAYGTRGSMVLPYASSTYHPLTVYTEQNFQGDSCKTFGLENDGGYMVTMTDKQLNNRIRSFRLKRGYMVTFATQASGYGYQRCFIANDADLEVSSLPQILDSKITSYRIFKWNTLGKKGLASSANATACDELNVISCYSWDVGYNMYPDVECVANHLYEDYPSSSACGKATWTGHMKTNNEPRNGSDDNPQSLSTILNNWQNLMRTGMRLCSPSSWDGSDNTDGSGFIKQFLDSIDARGWRCDLVDLHCYWLVDNFNNLSTMHSVYKRPIWISEWIWGASWNKNGIFESGKTDWDNEWAVKTICNKLNSYGFVERYFYWNSESKGKIYDNGLTVAGKWYASQLTGMGYNKSYEKVPNLPRMRGGYRDFRVSTETDKAVITWHDYDGEYNQLMEVLRKKPGEAWQEWQTITPQDAEADYSITDTDYTDGTRYRLHIRSFKGRDYYSSEDMEPGEAIETGNGTRYVGGNLIANGNFRMGLYGWTSGTGEPLSKTWFGVYPKALTDGYFLQCLGDKGKNDVASLLTAFDVVPGQDYVFRVGGQNAGEYIKLVTRPKGNEQAENNRLTLANKTYWSTQQAVFNTESHNEAVLAFRWLAGTAQLGDMELYQLFPTREEAIADGIVQARKKAATVMTYNTQLPGLNTEMQSILSADLSENTEEALFALHQAIDNMQQAIENHQVIDSLLQVAQAVADWDFDGREELVEAMQTAANANTADEINSARYELQQTLTNFLAMSEASTQPQSPNFATTDGWETKVGTFTGGDQRTATKEDLKCWNAWWSGISAAEGEQKTMEIRQTISNLPEGLYSLECKGATEHNCISDQHGYIISGTDTLKTSQLKRGYLDIPNTISAWQTMGTTPVYVGEGGSVTIGFIGSKKGAEDNAWRQYGYTNEKESSSGKKNEGDKREGWWCATDFRLLYHPIYHYTVVPNQWGAICLPYAYRVPKGMKLYRFAGLLADLTKICLEEVDGAEAGMPYIYKSEQAEVVFYANGEATRNAQRYNNLRGNFVTYTTAPAGSYLLKEGVWQRIKTREPMTNYSAIITKVEGMPILESWDGETMPIVGATEELVGVKGVKADGQATDTKNYDLSGRKVENAKGVIIDIRNGEAKKVVRK